MHDELRFIKFAYGKKTHDDALEALLSDYFDDLFSDTPDENVPKEKIPLVVKKIGEETLRAPECLFFCEKDGEFIGFSNFQIDQQGSTAWCKREGSGFICEFFILPSHRRKGYARRMYSFSENFLKSAGARSIYLNTDSKEGFAFWRAVGFTDSSKIDDTNSGHIFEKELG